MYMFKKVKTNVNATESGMLKFLRKRIKLKKLNQIL